jgi:hypothetical protein
MFVRLRKPTTYREEMKMAEQIKKTVTNTTSYKGNLTFTVIGKCWNPLDAVDIPVEYTVTGCSEEADALRTTMEAFCGNLYDWTIR